MLFKVALVLLAGWAISALTVPGAGKLIHLLLLAGLALLLLGFLRAREEAMRRDTNDRTDKS